jgi:abortive phage resistance protein AbiGi (putative antitoxin)
MSGNISSAALFHFTNSFSHLKSILRHGFYPHYCCEYTLDLADRRAALERKPPTHALPIVSFCDLPLSVIWEHLEAYGHFGIGLRKEWGVRNGLAPVVYTHRKAVTRTLMSRITNRAISIGETVASERTPFLAAYVKPFNGYAWRRGRSPSKITFYDEREWRYVPPVGDNIPLFLKRSEYRNSRRRDFLHNRLRQKYTLPVHPDDIQYLVVPSINTRIMLLSCIDM